MERSEHRLRGLALRQRKGREATRKPALAKADFPLFEVNRYAVSFVGSEEMPIPETYRVQNVGRRCEICQNGDKLNHVTYCRLGEESITRMIMRATDGIPEVLEKLKLSEVNPFGVCDQFE